MNPAKDVDGFHPQNVGKLVIGDPTALRPCTPYGVQQMLIRSGIETKGAHAVVVGRSTIVGKPMANLLIQTGPGGDATVTVCHSKTRDLPAVCRSADILIAAIGRAEFVTRDFVKPGAVIIDVGINRVDDASRPRGYRLTGDVAYAECAEIASAITPVPGGVGPMTIAMLMQNTLQAMRQVDAVTLPLPFGPAGLDPAEVWSVSDLNQAARSLLEQNMPPVWVRGEVTSFKSYASGHWYFTLQDGSAQVRCVMWRTWVQRAKSQPEEGAEVHVFGTPGLWEEKGEFRFTATVLLRSDQLGQQQQQLEADARGPRARWPARPITQAARCRATRRRSRW